MVRSVIFLWRYQRAINPLSGGVRKKPTHRRRASALADCLTWPQVALNRHGLAVVPFTIVVAESRLGKAGNSRLRTKRSPQDLFRNKSSKPRDADVAVGGEWPPELIKKLVPTVQSVVSALRYWNQPPGGDSEEPSALAESRRSAITWPVLRPPDGAAEASWPEIVRVENLFDKNPQRSFESAEHVVHGDDGSVDEVRLEHVDIGLRALVRMIAIDPEKTNRVLPLAREVV